MSPSKRLFLALVALVVVGCADKGDTADLSSSATDTDGDTGPIAQRDADLDGSPNDEDCDDEDATVYPGAPEVCDGIDNDCDELVDDADSDVDPASMSTWHVDADGDGFGDAHDPGQASCDPVGTDVANDADCDDTDPMIHPDATEVCGGVDEDCDGLLDADDPDVEGTAYYPDGDSDGFGDASAAATLACEAPGGHVPDASDCDDADPEVNPDATEVCNGVDDDCSGSADEGLLGASYEDSSGITDLTAEFDAGSFGAPASHVIDTDGTLTLCPGVWYVTLYVDGADVAVVGAGSGLTTLSGGDAAGVLEVKDSASLVLRDVTLRDAEAASGKEGSAVSLYDVDDVSLVDVELVDSFGFVGGGLRAEQVGALTMERVSFRDNTGSSGGGLYAYSAGGGVVDMVDVEFVDNVAWDGRGGAIYATGLVTIHADGGSFSGNTSALDGGAVRAYDRAHFAATGTTLYNNTSGDDGGALALALDATAALDSCTVADNEAVSGGGAHVSDGELSVTTSLLDGNTPQDVYAGGSYTYGAWVSLHCTDDGCTSGVPLSSLVAGDLVVSEILQDPAAVDDADGEWFEIYNNSGVDVLLDGLEVGDDGTDGLTVSTGFTLAAGGYAVLGANGDPLSNGGVGVDIVYDRGFFQLANGVDEVVLGYGGTTLDRVAYGGAAFPDPTGATLSLDPSLLDAGDNDLGASWCEAADPFGDGDLGTPGAANPPC